jgi:hypothetical protein
MIRIGRRARRRLIRLTAGLLVLAAIVLAIQWRNRHMKMAGRNGAAALAPGTLRLPFTLPCAIYSGDATPVYTAIRGRDKDQLMHMVAQKRVMMLMQGTSVALMRVNQTAMVSIYGGGREGRTCYVPSEMVPVIERRIPR